MTLATSGVRRGKKDECFGAGLLHQLWGREGKRLLRDTHRGENPLERQLLILKIRSKWDGGGLNFFNSFREFEIDFDS